MKLLRITLVQMAFLVSLGLFAQNNSNEDYYFYIGKVRQHLLEGNCVEARKVYAIYKSVSNNKDLEIEHLIEDCVSGGAVLSAFSTQGNNGGYDYVDLGLPSGLMWATCNLGAATPIEFGDYYAWGETASKHVYDWSHYKFCKGTEHSLTKYCKQKWYGYNGVADSIVTLDQKDDAAAIAWGNGWRIPTEKECDELFEYCTSKWTSINGVNGYLLTGLNGNNLFLPATGSMNGTSLNDFGNWGHYWSNSNDCQSSDAVCININKKFCDVYLFERCCGASIRPVFVSNKKTKSKNIVFSSSTSNNNTHNTYKDEDNYSYYIQKAKQHLAEGNCNEAEKCYSVYKDLSHKKDIELEQWLSDCITGKTILQTTPEIIQIGNDIKVVVNGTSFIMKYVEGGTFVMGATANDGGYEGEEPAHQVTLSSYYIGETEVTQGLWRSVMGTLPDSWIGEDMPVEDIGYQDCIRFIDKLNFITNMVFALPTEAQWEYAARGGRKSKEYKYSGGDDLNAVAWNVHNSNEEIHKVKLKLPNELGLYDMSGNVWEWCSDWDGVYESQHQYDPTGPISGDSHVFRGGSCWGDGIQCRVLYRYYAAYFDTSFGFRLVLKKMN